MAVIHETLTLEDKFSTTFTKFLQMGNKAAGASTMAKNAAANYQATLDRLDRQLIGLNAQFSVNAQRQQAMAAAGKTNTAAFAQLETQTDRLGATIRDLTAQYNAVEREAREAASATKQFEAASQTTQVKSNGLMGTIRNLAGAFLGIQTGQWLVGTSDQLTQINARLQLMTGSAEAAAEANDQIYQAAMRARGAYTDMADLVSQLGTLAPDAFSDPAGNLNTGELIAFAEQLQKQMALSGTSTQAAQAAMLQLTQGLASGVLRGEELNSVLEQTPMVAQTIADYMGVNVGTMRELASEGAITADVVKNALLGAADETNAAFAQMPMTWGQVWNTMQNTAIQALQPVLDFINFLANNMGVVVPIVAGATAAMLGFAAASWLASGGLKTLVASAKAFATTMGPVPFLIAAGIGIVVALIAKWVQSIGGLEIAWLTLKDVAITAGENMMYALLSAVTNATLGIRNLFVSAAEFVQGLVNAVIGGLNTIISAVNSVTGSSIGAIQEASFADKMRNSYNNDYAFAQADLQKAHSRIYQAQLARGHEIALKKNEMAQAASDNSMAYNTPTYDQVAGATDQLSGIGSSVKGIEKAVNMSDEDIKALVDVAERRYVNQVNLTSQTPVITVNGANTGRTAQDRRALADAIEQILREEWASGSVRSTAYA